MSETITPYRVLPDRPSEASAAGGGKKKQSSPDVVVHAIKQGILTGRYVPGQRVLEADLQKEHGVSRGPVREALTRLAAEHVVEPGPNRGTYIRALTRAEILDLLQVLKVLIDLAVRLAVVRCRYGDNKRKLTEAHLRLQAQIGVDDPVALAIERTRFYETLFEISGNPELARVHPTVAAQILRVQVHSHLSRDDHRNQYDDYRPLYDAIVGGDVRSATRIVDRHLRRSRIHAQHLPEAAFVTGSLRTR